MNISGNFDTALREVDIVKKMLRLSGVEYENVEKSLDTDGGDVIVTAYGKKLIIEVKEEDYETRFCRYRQLGIDFLSVFQFKQSADRAKWYGVKSPSMYDRLFGEINISKYGKLYYSRSHLWLFYSIQNDTFKYARFFDGRGITSDAFRKYLFDNCSFAVNNKPSKQLSYSDRFQSAVIYIDSDDARLNELRVDDLPEFINNMRE